MSLIHRLMLLVVVALVPASALQIYSSIEQHRQREREIVLQAGSLVELVASEHERMIEGVRQVLLAIRQTPLATSSDYDLCQSFMDALRPDYPEYVEFYIADLTGTVQCGTEIKSVGLNISDRYHFKTAIESKNFTVGEYILRRPSNVSALPFAMPIHNREGEIIGVAAALLDARWLASYITAKPLPEGAALIVADRNGTVIARVPELPGAIGSILPENFQALAREDRQGSIEMVGLDDKVRAFGYVPVKAHPKGVFLSIGIDKQLAMAPINRAMMISLALIACGLGSILLVMWIGSGKILRAPIESLVKATNQWRAGDLKVRAMGIPLKTEIGFLAQAFNDMATDMESQAKLREEVHDTAYRMAEILGSTTDGVFDLDREWRFTFVNSRAKDLMMSGRDVIDQSIWDVFPRSVGSVFWEQYHRAMQERVPVEFEAFSEHLQRWYFVRAFPSKQGLAVYFQDVDDRRKTEARLREQEAQYRAIVETAVDAMVVIDEMGRIQSFNPAAERIFGYNLADVMGENVRMLMPAPYHASHDGYLDHYKSTGERRIIGIGRQVEGRRKDGSVFPLELSVAEWTADGRRSFTGIMRDVTARKRIEIALEDSLKRTTEILESIGDGFYALDGDWRFSYVNQRALEIFGKSRDDVLGLSIFEVFPKTSGSSVHKNLDQVMNDRQPKEFEAMSPNFGIWVAFNVYPQAGGGISVHFRDISAQKAAEAAASASEMEYRTLVLALPQLVWTCDTEGKCTFLSAQWNAYTGWDEEAGLGDGWLEAIHPDDRQDLSASWTNAVANGTMFDTETRIRAADGTYRWFKQRAIPLKTAEGGVSRWFGTSTDISSIVEAKEILGRAKEDAEQANLAKSKFLASASHDLRQPMQSLFLFTAALESHVTGPEGKENLMHLERGLDALKGLLDSLLDVSRLDAGVVEPTMEGFPISLLFDHLAASYAPVAAGKGLDWYVVPSSQYVRSDRVLLGRIIRNLIENAVRYTQKGRILIDSHPVGDFLRITVQDTGIGIPEDHLHRIWEEFHQVGNSERDRAQGLGLGLAIVQRIANLLGYRLQVSSREGEGSSFSLDVPLGAARPLVEVPAKSVAAVERSGKCALVVDDDAIVLLALQAMLSNWGYEVVIAADAEQAVRRLEAVGRDPDIILADYRLREGRVGTEVIAKVRESCGRKIPGVILTGETGSECQTAVIALGLGLAFKPVTPRQLSVALERQMQAAE